MPRKSKEESPKTEKEIVSKRSKSTTKNDTSSTKKTVAKKATALKTEELKKVSTKTVRNSSSKSSVAKKTKSKSTKTTVKKSEKKLINNSTNVVEYYDLPQKYNQTVVKVLAQTPKTLFVYWEISDDDIEKFKNDYGENFFETTKPVLIIHNDTLNYSFEVDINDFANSWYLHVNDSNSDYRIELGRRPLQINENIQSDYIYITSSNEIESPNDHILFNNSQKMVYFRNVKTNVETSKPLSSLSFIRNMGKIYEIYDLYQELYKNEENIEDLTNPSSHTSSQFK
ncbi:putative uncharacterized protein [Clostridium sp. CAG:389]|nr:putative uncharacterized protein [Clostridium sp. CAG:389]